MARSETGLTIRIRYPFADCQLGYSSRQPATGTEVAFETLSRSTPVSEYFGVSVVGSKCGVHGQGMRSEQRHTKIVPEGTGVIGSGDVYGVHGIVNSARAVMPLAASLPAAAAGAIGGRFVQHTRSRRQRRAGRFPRTAQTLDCRHIRLDQPRKERTGCRRRG